MSNFCPPPIKVFKSHSEATERTCILELLNLTPLKEGIFKWIPIRSLARLEMVSKRLQAHARTSLGQIKEVRFRHLVPAAPIPAPLEISSYNRKNRQLLTELLSWSKVRLPNLEIIHDVTLEPKLLDGFRKLVDIHIDLRTASDKQGFNSCARLISDNPSIEILRIRGTLPTQPSELWSDRPIQLLPNLRLLDLSLAKVSTSEGISHRMGWLHRDDHDSFRNLTGLHLPGNRGYLQQQGYHLTSSFIYDNIRLIERNPNLTELTISVEMRRLDKLLPALRQLGNLRHILIDPPGHDIDFKPLLECIGARLESLTMGMKIDQWDDAAIISWTLLPKFRLCPNLKSLTIPGIGITSSWNLLFQGMDKLADLELTSCDWEDCVTISTLLESEEGCLPQLSSLKLNFLLLDIHRSPNVGKPIHLDRPLAIVELYGRRKHRKECQHIQIIFGPLLRKNLKALKIGFPHMSPILSAQSINGNLLSNCDKLKTLTLPYCCDSLTKQEIETFVREKMPRLKCLQFIHV